MNLFRLLAAALLFALSAAVSAQTGERGSLPPGQSKDGAAPSDGAIKGGSILPGETSGIPEERKMQSRCHELTATLREECLKQEREAGGGGTKPPSDIVEPKEPKSTTK